MAFHNVRLPDEIEKGAQGGPGFSTNILELSAGDEKRNRTWSRPSATWDVGYGVDNKAQLEQVLAFFYARQGRANDFRFKDWTDYQIGSNATDVPQQVAIGDGTTTVFQIVRTYTSGNFTFNRIITRIVSGTLRVFVNSVEQGTPADYTADIDTGLITFVTAPINESDVAVICEFDIPVRFASDMLDVRALGDDAISMPEIPLIEIKERPEATSLGLVETIPQTSTLWTLDRIATQEFDVKPPITNPQSIYMVPSGLKIIICESNPQIVYELDLVSPFVLDGASLGSSINISATASSPTGVTLGSNGVKMYIADSTLDSILEYDLSTAFDVTTAVFNQSKSVLAQDASIRGVNFRGDGLKMYVIGNVSDAVHEYNLSTAWDVSTAVFSQSFSVAAQDNSVQDMNFKEDGTRFWAGGVQNDTVYEYDLSTAWDISTASYNGNQFFIAQGPSLRGLLVDPTGFYLFTISLTNGELIRFPL